METKMRDREHGALRWTRKQSIRPTFGIEDMTHKMPVSLVQQKHGALSQAALRPPLGVSREAPLLPASKPTGATSVDDGGAWYYGGDVLI